MPKISSMNQLEDHFFWRVDIYDLAFNKGLETTGIQKTVKGSDQALILNIIGGSLSHKGTACSVQCHDDRK
jgi:hypothetical protein